MRKIVGDEFSYLWNSDDTLLPAGATFMNLNGGPAVSQTDSVFTVPLFDKKSFATGDATSSLNAGSNLLSAATLEGSSNETVAFANSGIVFVNTYTARVTQAYKNNISAAEQDIAAHWTNSITLKLTFDAQAKGTNTFLASNTWPSFVAVSYTALKNALTAHDASNPDAQAAVAALPATDPNPAGGNDWNLPEAYARMLGLSQGAPATDDTVLLNTSYSWAYGQDVIATIEHEITEGAMGRIGGLGDQNGVWSTMDLFRFSAVGVRDFTDGRDGKNTFFSVSGSQLLLQFNNEFSGATKVNPNDTADYLVSDVFGTGSPGDARTLSDTDLKNMNVLGWTPVDTTTPSLIHEGSITLAVGATATIPSSQLQFNDNISTHAQETYSIVTAPAHGTLLKSGSATSSFTQADIDNGLISYHENGSVASSDSFVFKVTDAAGNQTTAQQFQFQILPPPDTTAPAVTHDSLLTIAAGATNSIVSSLLQFDDNTSTHLQETYTIVTGPTHGTLLKSGLTTTSFTQADIDNGLISYHETAPNVTSDSFVFNVSDVAGNHTANTLFQIAVGHTATNDFSGDGKSDILWRHDNGTVVSWDINDSHILSTNIFAQEPSDWKIAGTGDFNSDGKADVLWHDDNGFVATWDMNDGQVLKVNVLGQEPNEWKIAGTGDFNGDGKADILWRNDNGLIATWDMNDGQVLKVNVLGQEPTQWKIAGIGDFNGDHKADILWRHDNGTIATWDMNDNQILSVNVLGQEPTEWKIARTGDFSGDGKADILWRHDNGTVVTWDMNDSQVVSLNILAQEPNDWHIIA
jgi:hypothetical protein